MKERFDAVYGDSSPSMAPKTGSASFCVVASVNDEPRPGALKTATAKDNVTKFHDLILADRRLKKREILF